MDRFAFIWLHLDGRIGRRTWLPFAVMIALLEYVTEIFLRRIFHWPAITEGAGTAAPSLGDEISVLSALIFLWPSIAIDVKRWHDIGLSGWMVLFVYVPAIAFYGLGLAGVGTAGHPNARVAASLYIFGLAVLVYFIILAARRGMTGPNRYGPAPD